MSARRMRSWSGASCGFPPAADPSFYVVERLAP